MYMKVHVYSTPEREKGKKEKGKGEKKEPVHSVVECSRRVSWIRVPPEAAQFS